VFSDYRVDHEPSTKTVSVANTRPGLAFAASDFRNLLLSKNFPTPIYSDTEHMMTKASFNTPTRSALARKVVYLQIAIQTGMALTPFYAVTVQAATAQPADTHIFSGSASRASELGQAAQSGNLSGYASQQATRMGSQALQQWLSNFGTARVELGTDSHFKPTTGSADLLLPLHSSPERLLFTQTGVRNVDGQITGNIGLGQRHFTGDWMLGYNAFYDQNFSRGHKRMGMGVEAWRDYLKLSGNGYYRLSDWRNSRDVEDYDARPANGFDLRAEAWLPAYAAIGGRLMYEQYYGNEVALFGKDRRQKNPSAITAGLSYTPVPLISFTADHKRGGSQNDTRFGLQLSYQLGQPFAAQVDPSAVNLQRMLAGSGMDLVERNNNIVLEYRKQQLINLTLPKEITGESGKVVPVTYQLTSKYGLAKIVWNDAAVVAAGGKMQDLGGGQYQLVLPAYTAGASNTWPLSGVAYDSRNNASKLATTTVTVTRPSVSAAKSSVTASPETIIADGASTSLITLTLNDETGAPVTGLAADISVALKEEAAVAATKKAKVKDASGAARPASLGKVKEQASGVYTVTLTAGNRPMQALLSPVLGTLALPAVKVNQISDAASAVVKDGDLQVTGNNAVANGTATNGVQARVTDATGNPVAGVVVTFSLSGAAQVAPGSSLTATSDTKGLVSMRFISTVAETVTVSATTASAGSAKAQATFIADKTTAALDKNDLTVDRITAVANGSDKVTYSAIIKDASGNPVPDITVTWAASGGSLAAGSSITDAGGKATMTLTNTVAQMVQSTARLAAGAAVDAPVVSFGADASSGGISQNDIVVNKNSATANGSDAVTYTVLVKDANGNPLANQAVEWKTTLGTLSAASGTTDATGHTSVTLTSVQAAAAQVAVNLAGKAAVNAPLVTFTADSSSAQIDSSDLTVDKNSIVGNSSDAATFSAVVKDAHGNPVAGQTVSWSTDRGMLSAATSTTNASGVAIIRLTGSIAGSAQVAAIVNGKAAVNAPQVTITPDSSSAQIGSGDLTADKTGAVADGTEKVTYTALVKDASGNPVPGVMVSWGSNLGSLSAASSSTDASGNATITLTSKQAGSATVTAKPGSGAQVSAAAVTFTADGSSAAIGSGDLTVDKTTVVANNTDRATYTALVKDANGNPVANHTVNWRTDAGTLSGSSSTTGSDGKATIELRHTKAEQATVTATVNTVATDASVVTFIGDVTTARIKSGDVKVSKTSIIANNSDSATVTATVRDANDNTLPGINVAWKTDSGTLSVSTGITNSSGEVSTQLSGALTGATTPDEIATVTAQLDATLETDAPSVTLVVPAQNYTGPQITFTGSNPPKEANLAITGRTGVVTDNIIVTVRISKADASSIYYSLKAPSGKTYKIKDTSDAHQEVNVVNVAGESKAGKWTLMMDDVQAGTISHTLDWDLSI
jgi:adhesin/invasin